MEAANFHGSWVSGALTVLLPVLLKKSRLLVFSSVSRGSLQRANHSPPPPTLLLLNAVSVKVDFCLTWLLAGEARGSFFTGKDYCSSCLRCACVDQLFPFQTR